MLVVAVTGGVFVLGGFEPVGLVVGDFVPCIFVVDFVVLTVVFVGLVVDGRFVIDGAVAGGFVGPVDAVGFGFPDCMGAGVFLGRRGGRRDGRGLRRGVRRSRGGSTAAERAGAGLGDAARRVHGKEGAHREKEGSRRRRRSGTEMYMTGERWERRKREECCGIFGRVMMEERTEVQGAAWNWLCAQVGRAVRDVTKKQRSVQVFKKW